jgi:hypothetical protein
MESLPKREWFNSAFFTLIIRPSVIGRMSVLRPKRRAQGHWLHIDNEKSHKHALPPQKTEKALFIRLPQLPIPMNWHTATSSYSGTWRKNKKGGTQVRKLGDHCGETNFKSNPDSNVFRRVWTMDREIARVHGE